MIIHHLTIKGNVLVDNDGNGVILDFGLSRLRFETSRTLTNIQASGTLRFLAPELSTGEDDFRTTEKSDTYSFGMLIYQLLYNSIPYSNIPNEFAVLRKIMLGYTPDRPKLPDGRIMFPAWVDVEEKLWNTLQDIWEDHSIRIELDEVHKTV